MPLPSWIPSQYRGMISTIVKIDPNSDDADLIDFLSGGQRDEVMQGQMQRDKMRAVKNVGEKIQRKKESLKKARKDLKRILKKDSKKNESKKNEMLSQKLDEFQKLENDIKKFEHEQFDLLRDEILSACKDGAGLIDMKKLAKIPGSSTFIKQYL